MTAMRCISQNRRPTFVEAHSSAVQSAEHQITIHALLNHLFRRELALIQKFKEHQEHEAPFDKYVCYRPSVDPIDGDK